MLFLTLTLGSNPYTPDFYTFVIGKDVETAQPYRMIGAPMHFDSLREAVEAAAFCGLTVLPDGRVVSQAA